MFMMEKAQDDLSLNLNLTRENSNFTDSNDSNYPSSPMSATEILTREYLQEELHLNYMNKPSTSEECDKMMFLAGVRKEEIKKLLSQSEINTKIKKRLTKELTSVRKRLTQLLDFKGQ